MKHIVQAMSWNTLTILVKISPTYPRKKEGEFVGAVTTLKIDLHIGTRVRRGKISCMTVYNTSKSGKAPDGTTSGIS
jgi:hypothetical protein